jgi:hypothetical protein
VAVDLRADRADARLVTPAAGQDTDKSGEPEKPDATFRGRVQSVKDETVVLKTEDGKTVTFNMKDITAAARALINVGEPIIVTGQPNGDEVKARSLTVAATLPGARVLAGQPPLTPAEGAASPATEDRKPAPEGKKRK